MSSLQSITQKLSSLLKQSSNPDPAQAKKETTAAKLALLQKNLLLPSSNTSPADLVIARDLLEQCALFSARTNDIAAFTRFYSQLEPFYTLSSSSQPSALRPRIVSLLLLAQLAQNNIGGFHTILERLASADDDVLNAEEVAYTVQLEKALMQGSFAMIWRKREQMPSKDYICLLDTLMSTVRNEIASCSEKAYPQLPIQDAATLLFFNNMNDLMAFAATRPGWTVSPTEQVVNFQNEVAKPVTAEKSLLEREKVIKDACSYAQALESII